MINYKKKLIAIFMLVLMFLISCTHLDKQASKQVDYKISKGSNYTYFAPDGTISINYDALYTENVNYYFETKNYTEKQKNDFIKEVETLRAFFENELKISFDEPLSVYISKKNDFGGNNKKVFLYDLDLIDEDVTTVFIQSLFEDNINYGLCYGLACYVNEKLYKKPIKHKISIAELKKYYSVSENILLMDLTIPVFQTVYFNINQNKYSYATSYYFVKDLIERKGPKYAVYLLQSSSKLEIDFDIEYTNEKNTWLANIGATQKCEAPLIPLRFKISTESKSETYPYIIYTPSTMSRFIPNIKFVDEGLIMNYAYVKRYLSMYEQDLSALKNYLSPYFDTKKDAIDCYFGGEFESNFYTHNENINSYKIEYFSPLDAGVHEYVHYLTWIDDLPLWLIEGVAEYCTYYLVNKDVYRMIDELHIIARNNSLDSKKFYNKDRNSLHEIGDKDYINLITQYNAYLNSINKIKIKNLAWYYPNRKNEDGADLSYKEAASLVNYLIKTYGEKKFFDLYNDYSDVKLENTYGKTFKDLREEWYIALNNTFGINYILGPDESKILYTDTNEKYLPSKRLFSDILDGKTYEYVNCSLARNKDDETDPTANDFEGLDLKGKIALIQRGAKDKYFFYKQVNNAVKAGAVGVIVYNNEPGYFYMSLEGVAGDIPAIAILMEDGELLKNAKDKRVTISKDFIGVIDNNSSDN